MENNNSFKNTIVIALAITIIASVFISGCTYLVRNNNDNYYKTMEECIQKNGSFIPLAKGSSSSICFRSDK